MYHFAQDAPWVQKRIHLSVGRDLKSFWTIELAEAEITSRAADSVPSGSDVREIGSLEFTEATRQPVEMEGVSTDQVVERAGGASPQLDEEQVQPMDVSLDQSVTTSATKRRAETQLTLNSVEGYTGGLRSFDGRQAEQVQEMLAMVVAKDEFSVDTIDDDSRQFDHYTGKLLDRDKYITEREKELDQVEAYCVIRRVKKSEAIDGTHVRVKEMVSYATSSRNSCIGRWTRSSKKLSRWSSWRNGMIRPSRGKSIMSSQT